MKSKFIWVIVILIGAAAIWALVGNQDPEPNRSVNESNSQPTPQTQQSQNNTTTPSGKQETSAQNSGNMITGILQESDKPANGNLMVTRDGKKLYISTSRDFSALIGKQVDITYEGTLDNFMLDTIVEHK